jgi:D-glycero-D-manno-heptose 1,7-bisphosphate phosphatase
MNKALFLDRDGIINRNFGHVFEIKKIVFLNGIFELSKYFFEKGYLIFIVTNQAGISKNLYTLSDFELITKWIHNKFLENGIQVSETFFCPHKEEDLCDCRKPKPGLLLKAISKYDIDIHKSIMIGDKITDYNACISASIKTCILKPKNVNLNLLLTKLKKNQL